MQSAYCWADLVVARAGALTVSEISAVGVAAVFIPFPHAVDDHQTANATVLVAAGAAKMIAEHELTASALVDTLAELARSPNQLAEMADRARQLARPGAAKQVADACRELAYA